MRIDNEYIYDLHEMEQARLERRREGLERLQKEELPFTETKIEVAFYINEREEDIEILEKFLTKHKFDYEKEVI